MENIKK